MRRARAWQFAVAAVVLSLAAPVWADEPDITSTEINALIEAVGASGCEFERNGKTYNAGSAAAHLRLKYRRGKKYADSAEAFIERLASKSSRSGKPYHMQCPEQPRVTTAQWLTLALEKLRRAS